MTITLNGTTGITTPDIDSTTSTLGPLTQALNLGSTGQIVFPATQNASSNANTLDDYEEGTWTPSSGNLGTFTVVYARYTKIGNTVTAMCSFSCTSTPTRNLSRFSLPFASNGSSAGAWTRSTVEGGQLESQNSNANCYFATTASTTGTIYTTIVYQVA